MTRPSRHELTLGVILALNLILSFWLYQTVTAQDKRIKTLERDDAIKQHIQSLDQQYQSLKQHIQGLIH